MPPSSNNLYNSYRSSHGHIKRSCTKEYQAYRNEFKYWRMAVLHQNFQALSRAVSEWVDEGEMFIHVDRYYFFHRQSLLTRIKKPKKMDVSNRIKAQDDAVSDCLGVDDRYFWSGSEVKLETDGPQCAAVRLSRTCYNDQQLFIGKLTEQTSMETQGFLCITRKKGEGIDIADGMAQVFIKDTFPKATSLAIRAHRTVRIKRLERKDTN